MSFEVKDGYLYCEELRVKDIQNQVPDSPFYLYSRKVISENYLAYVKSLEGISSLVSYAIKANNNFTILKYLQKLGSGATLVSGNELRLASAVGFNPEIVTYNGNGKTRAELSMAVEQGVMINIDSEFDMSHIEKTASEAGKPARVTIRINPDVDPEVHPYVATGIRDSKFGIRNERLPWFLEQIKKSPRLNLVGLHCHLGSTIEKVRIFFDATELMMQFVDEVRQMGHDLQYLNIGGGLGIDYLKNGTIPKQSELIESIRALIPGDISLIMEPGRSIVGDAGVLINRVTGVKTNDNKNFIVTDGSMADLIRPSLYGAYHHIGFIEPVDGAEQTFDIVGPICEAADFLGKERILATPHETAGLAVYDAGAYSFVMSSNYNIKLRPAEYLVDGSDLKLVRRAQTFDDFMQAFETENIN